MAATSTHTYTNRQGNTVEIVHRADGTVQSVEVSGTALEHSDVQGKSRTFRQAKRQHAFDILTAAPV